MTTVTAYPSIRLTMSFVAAALTLTACGGGDDPAPAPVATQTPAPAPTPTPAPSPAPATGTKFTKAQVLEVAQLGTLVGVLTEQRGLFMVDFQVGTLIAFSALAGGSTSDNVSCSAGGSAVRTAARAAPRTGLAVGDSLTVAYSNCRSQSTVNGAVQILVINGTVKMTAESDMANLAVADHDVRFTTTMTNFSLQENTAAATVFNGTLTAGRLASNGNVATTSFAVPTGGAYTVNVSGVNIRFEPMAKAVFGRTLSNNGGSLSLDGATITTTAGAPAPLSLTFKTTTPLAGNTAKGYVVPAAGSMNVTDPSKTLATSIAYSGTVATVSGDTDKDGTLDLTFSSTWAELSGGL
jgi:hypothetical protein